jgi:hypothetical protein
MESLAFQAYPLFYQSSVQVDQSTPWSHALPAAFWQFHFSAHPESSSSSTPSRFL